MTTDNTRPGEQPLTKRDPGPPLNPYHPSMDSLVFRYATKSCPASPDSPEQTLLDMKELVDDLQPKGAMEEMLAAQMVPLFFFIRYHLNRAINEKNPVRQEHLNAAVRLQKLFLQQINMLAALRGSKQQRVRIEHINISGGQSIIASQVENQKAPEKRGGVA